MIAVILVVLILILFLWWFLTISHYNSLKTIPGPKPLPFIGNVLSLGRNSQELFTNFCALTKRYGEMFKIFIGPECKLIISDPEIIENVLTSNVHIAKSNAYSLMNAWLGDGLITSKGEKWKQRRKLLTPCFHFAILERFIKHSTDVADKLNAKLENEVGGHSFNVSPYVHLSSLMLMCESAMGLNIDAKIQENANYINALREYLAIFAIRAFSMWQRSEFLFKFAPTYKTYIYCVQVLHQFADSIICKRREETKAINSDVITDNDVGVKSKVALLDFLLKAEAQNLLNNNDIRDEINTFLAAGHETIATGYGYLLLMLSRHQDVQQKVFEEIVDIFGNTNAISMHKLLDMKYFDCVIKETFRLYPPVAGIERSLESEFTIDGRFTIPAKTTLLLFFYGLHHNGKYFPDPEKFDPSRFSQDNSSKRHNYCYLPFSAGPRNCIGQRYALMALKVFTIKMLLKYKVLPVENFEPDLGFGMVLKTYNGIRIRLYNREY